MTGLDRRTQQRLARGQLRIEAVLDLHGMTRTQAERRLYEDLSRFVDQGIRCILVVTGKGEGILQKSLLHALSCPNLSGLVIAHETARGADGGDGARYVLLRRKSRVNSAIANQS